MSSPGLYTPSDSFTNRSSAWAAGTAASSPYLHPLQMHTVRETHKAAIEQDFVTGRKLINQYEILGEIGRGVHGKVKLARNLETNEKVAIKIIQRNSKKRRLTRVAASPEVKTKREIAILKKIRHPDIVGLYEVIDDPDYKKIYMILEYVELGEIKWRRKGTPQICAFERRRIERELRGEESSGDEEKLFKMSERRRLRKEAQRAKHSDAQSTAGFWSLEHGDDEEDFGDVTPLSRVPTHESLFMPRSYQSHTSHTSMVRSTPSSKPVSRAPSCTPSRTSSVAHRTPIDLEVDGGGLSSISSALRGRSPSTTGSFMSQMSSIDDVVQHDSFEEDFSYVPCFTMDQARSTFRDTVLGLEYLHYQGIVHRDIKPANLLWTKEHRVKISDFGVSFFGRPVRDGDREWVSDEGNDFDDDIELSKTVGTPAFFAPELCYTDLDLPQPRINDQIDVWSLGVTLYCLIFARIPFLAEDEYQLFKAIAQQDVYIPKRRLKAVNPCPDEEVEEGVYREDGDLVMEDIDDELYDLLRRMLVKDPAERIKLREVKRHPWVLRGIDNIIAWLDDTDPSRRAAGKRIQVDERELERAVVPISFVERARSAVKKAVGKVLGRSDGSGSRKRATSTANSSADGGSTPQTPIRDRDSRRGSTRGDESYFGSFPEHPLSQSVTASPTHTPNPSDPISISHHFGFRPAPTRTESVMTVVPTAESLPSSPFAGYTDAATFSDTARVKNTRSMDPMKRCSGENGRTRSADRAEQTGVFKMFADARHTVFGNHNFHNHHHAWSTDSSPVSDHTGNPLLRASLMSRHKQSMSSPVVNTKNFAAALVENQNEPAARLWEKSGSSELASPVGSSVDRFPSHPSLPALVSGASSVSAENDITRVPTVRDTQSVTTNADPVILDRSEEQIAHAMYAAAAQREREEPPDHYSRDADDSDSDEGLTMGGRRGKVASRASDMDWVAEREKELARERQRVVVHRRNTNNSVGSTGTAKKVGLDD